MARDGRDGRDGLPGIDGRPGKQGPAGQNAYEIAIQRGIFSGTLEEWFDAQRGKDGDSVYQVAVRNGFVGTEDEFVRVQKGDPGPKGDAGPRGPQGPIGPMPEHEWNGTQLRFQMTPNSWGPYVDLKGEKGDGGGGTTQYGAMVVESGGSYFPSGW